MKKKKLSGNKKTYVRFIFVVVVFLFFIHGTVAQEKNKIIKVGYADCDPIFQDESGNYSGYAVSYLEEIARYTQWEYEYIFDSWKNCLQRLENGEFDLLVMAHHTSDRRGQFLFSNLPMGYDYPILYAAPNSDMYYQDYKAFDGARIGVSAETSFQETLSIYLQELDLNCQIITFPADKDAKAALLQGNIDMMVSSVFTPQKDVKVVDRFSVAPGYITTNLKSHKLMEEINNAMQKIRIHTPNLEDILMRTFYNVSKDVTNLYLTREEQEYINSVGTIVIKGFEDRRPIGYTDTDGEFKGILVDYLNQVGAMSGLQFTYKAAEYHTFNENIPSMQEEHFGILWAGDSVEDMNLSDSVYQSNPLFDTALAYVRRKGEYVTKYDDHTFVVSTDMHHVESLLLETNSESKIIYFESAKDCMEALLNKEADMAILSNQVADYWLNKPIYNNFLTRVAGSGAYVYGMCLYVPEEHRPLITIINKTLEHISDTQKLYMLENLGLAHTYARQFEDVLYEYEDALFIITVLLLILFAIGIKYLQYRGKKHKKEATQLRAQIQQSESIFRIVSEHSNRILYVYDIETKTTKPWDQENAKKDILAHVYAEMYSEENLEKNTAVFTEQKDTVKNFFTNIHGGIPSGEMNVRIRLLDGQLRWYHFKYSSIFHQEKPVSAMISIYDITERHEQEMAYLQIKKLTQSNIPGNKVSLEVNLTLDQVEKVEGIQEIQYKQEQGYSLAQLVNEVFAKNIDFIQKEEALQYFSTENFLAAYARGERELQSEWQIRYPEGTEHWLNTEITLIEDPYNQDIKLFLRMRDITEEKIKQLEIRERSEKDGMTGVYNRKTAEDLICQHLKKDARGIFLLVDMDRLKQINDVLGHKEGDKAIKGMAKILQSQFRSSDIVGRIGGDEFVVYLPGAAKNKETMSEVFGKLIKKLNSFTVGEQNDVAISCSIGCTIEEEDSSYETLYQQADMALYQVKKSGKNNFIFYSPEFGEDTPKSS